MPCCISLGLEQRAGKMRVALISKGANLSKVAGNRKPISLTSTKSFKILNLPFLTTKAASCWLPVVLSLTIGNTA